jgi:hypothetical protein
VFPEGSLNLGTLASPLMLLGAFVLDADFHPFLSVFGGRRHWFSRIGRFS